MALKSGDGGFRLGVINSGYIDAIAIAREHSLERLDFQTTGITFEARTIFDGAGGHEMTDPGLGQMSPRKMFAGINLAVGCQNPNARECVPERSSNARKCPGKA